ncbi:tripartite tricarboxylate transporter substrate binding protein [Ornithinimicrobium tianjinense]|uniref:C4-dicarboxylate ABC transporter substrate-binding protein n=1 Tax=Ornithinimicrobium tianjinense TaxID=1195761 RepID=A0A917BI20_9MICO|nr:tripartite tricarboxylate transporter substrate-binding protein [Ornithinimicrobium tianjinense]GGF40910.1 C4-dicarboxylate ABC transporter substrate-binding protein [Ornithinimicrobium tianjinense]
MRKHTLAAVVSATALTLAACGSDGADSGADDAAAGDYPKGPVKVIAPADPGSGWDLTARAVAADLAKEKIVTTPLPVENKPGAVGTVFLADMVEQQKGKDDVIAVTSMAMNVNTAMGQTPYSYKDVTMIAALSAEHFIVVTPKDSPYQDLDSALKAIADDPGSVPVGAATDDQFPFSLIVNEAEGDPTTINYVTYEGGGEQSTALLAGDVQLAIAGVSEFLPLLESGELRPLAVLAEEPIEGLDAPTTAELGYDVTIANWRGFYGPPEMPEEAVAFWQDAIEQLSTSESWKATAEKNQWTTQFMKGEDLTSYLDKTQQQVDEGYALVSGG